MAAQLKTYDFGQVTVIFGGRQLTGWAEGSDVVKVAYDTDAFTKKIGAAGEATRSKSNNRGAKITLKFMQTSDSNAILMGFYTADQANNSGAQPLMIKDNSGNDLHVAEKAWVAKLPDSGYGAEVGEREWVLETGDLTSVLGGN